MTPIYIALGIIVIALGYLITQQRGAGKEGSDPRFQKEIVERDKRIGELSAKIEKLQSEKDEQAGKGKQLYDSYKNLESELKVTIKERDALTKRVADFEAHAKQLERKNEDMIDKQNEALKAFEDEKARVRREDEERKANELAERDRMWNDHEVNVVALLGEITKKKHCKFTSYTNTHLPEEFTGNLKPDFMISFLKQYVIFDAKVSRSQDLKNYIKDAVKKTAAKVNGNENIYKTIFLVVPTDAIATLKEWHYYEEGFNFYVVSPEALEPILASLKRIEDYDLAEAINPQERENIVDMLAAFHLHVSTRNANELGMMIHGIETLSKAESALPDLVAEALVKKAKMRHVNLSTAETKDLIANPQNVVKQLLELVDPKPKIKIEKKSLVDS